MRIHIAIWYSRDSGNCCIFCTYKPDRIPPKLKKDVGDAFTTPSSCFIIVFNACNKHFDNSEGVRSKVKNSFRSSAETPAVQVTPIRRINLFAVGMFPFDIIFFSNDNKILTSPPFVPYFNSPTQRNLATSYVPCRKSKYIMSKSPLQTSADNASNKS